jgi:hypothetical protein
MKDKQRLEKELERLAIERETEGRLERIGRALVDAAKLNEEDLERVVSSPFLYTRVAARIASRRESEYGDFWFAVPRTAWKLVAGMAAAAIASGVLFQVASVSEREPQSTFVDEYAVAGPSRLDRIAYSDGNSLTSDDVLGTIVNSSDSESQQ